MMKYINPNILKPMQPTVFSIMPESQVPNVASLHTQDQDSDVTFMTTVYLARIHTVLCFHPHNHACDTDNQSQLYNPNTRPDMSTHARTTHSHIDTRHRNT